MPSEKQPCIVCHMQEETTLGEVKPYTIHGKASLTNYGGPRLISLCDNHGDHKSIRDPESGRYTFIDIFGQDQDLINVFNGMPNEY